MARFDGHTVGFWSPETQAFVEEVDAHGAFLHGLLTGTWNTFGPSWSNKIELPSSMLEEKIRYCRNILGGAYVSPKVMEDIKYDLGYGQSPIQLVERILEALELLQRLRVFHSRDPLIYEWCSKDHGGMYQ